MKQGDTPPHLRPDRMRGIYRAANRGESWAKTILKGGINGALTQLYYKVDFAELLTHPTPFWTAFRDSCKNWTGGYLVIPFGKRKRARYRKKHLTLP